LGDASQVSGIKFYCRSLFLSIIGLDFISKCLSDDEFRAKIRFKR
jgi:hypothetical protein